jgi:hypothetical protein
MAGAGGVRSRVSDRQPHSQQQGTSAPICCISVVPLWHSWNRGGSRPRPQNEKLRSSSYYREVPLLYAREGGGVFAPRTSVCFGARSLAICCLLLAPRNRQSLRLRRPSHIVFYSHSNGAHSIISPYPNPDLVLDRAIYSINVRFGRQAYTRLNTPVEAIVVTGTPLLASSNLQ